MASAHLPPLCIAPETWLLRRFESGSGETGGLQCGSLVIRGRQPALIDCGPSDDERAWLDDIATIVDPDDVRWILISHDDADHIGNLSAFADQLPRAIVVTNAAISRQIVRAGTAGQLPVVGVADGDTVDLGDRMLAAVAPPMLDDVSTLGWFDARTAVYWAADGFGAATLRPVDWSDQLPHDEWIAAAADFTQTHGPWRYPARVTDGLRQLAPEVLASAHGPTVTGARVAEALALAKQRPSTSPQEKEGNPCATTDR